MIKVLYNGMLLNGTYSGVQYTIKQLAEEACKNSLSDIYFEQLYPDKVFKKEPNRMTRIFFEHFRMQKYFHSQNFHLLHCPGYILPWNWQYPSVVTIHDTIALDFPKFCADANRAYFNLTLPRSIHRASKIIAVSNTVKNDILRRFVINPSKIEVIYHGIDSIFREIDSKDALEEVKRKYQLPDKFILYVGNIEPKKNIERLVQAYSYLVQQTGIPHSLLLVGQLAWKYQNVLRQIKHIDDSQRVRLLGYVPQEDLPSIYNLASLFVFPSLYEGFGIPPLEAMACKTPVIVSNTGALPETTKGCALLANPYSIESIAASMHQMLSDNLLRINLTKEGLFHVKQFNWSNTWEKTAQLYHSLIKCSVL